MSTVATPEVAQPKVAQAEVRQGETASHVGNVAVAAQTVEPTPETTLDERLAKVIANERFEAKVVDLPPEAYRCPQPKD